MEHYFINKEHVNSDYFTFCETFNDKKYKIYSCTDVFSNRKFDDGSLVLVNAIIKHKTQFENKNILDFACGYGLIAMLLSDQVENSKYYCTDINKTAIDLAKMNFKENKINNIIDVVQGDLFENVNAKFDVIVSNPPIKAGKKILFEFADKSKEFLQDDGILILVIKKNLGMQSLKEKLIEIYNNCEVIDRDRGYYVLECFKR